MSAMVISGAGANVVRYFPGEPTTKLVDCPLPRRACIQIKRILHACLRAQRINLNLALGSTAVAACSTAATNEDEADRRLTTSIDDCVEVSTLVPVSIFVSRDS